MHRLYIVNFLLLVLLSLPAALYAQVTSESTPDLTRNVTTIEINGTINPSTTDYIKVGLKEAEDTGSEALLILLDTPGGLLSSTKDIVKLLLNSEIPVVVYVSPKGASATSAGVFITMAGNIAAMAPGTSIGAAHPVSIGNRQSGPEKNPLEKIKPKEQDNEEENKDKSPENVMSEKVEEFAVSFIRSIAEERGRNVKWAEDAVRISDSITAKEALEKNVIDLISPNVSSLLSSIDGKKIKMDEKTVVLRTSGATQQKVEMSLKQRIINILSTPDIAFLLLSLGSLGIIVEFYNPGTIFPGVAGLISLIIGFVSLQILPFNYAGLALIFIGLALLASEMYIPSYGLLSIGGLLCLTFGGILLFDTNESNLRVGYNVIIGTSLTFGIFFAFVIYAIRKTFRRNTMSGYEGLVGLQGSVVDWSGTTGKAFINGEYWNIYSDEALNEGDKIKVIESEGSLDIKVSRLSN